MADGGGKGRYRVYEGGKSESGEGGGPRLRLLGMAEILAAPPRDYILKGWLSPGETSLIVGAKNARKSFIALHTGYAIAQGRARVWGRRIKQVPVLYVICEGIGGLSQRVKALRQKFGDCSAFHAIAQPLDLLHSTWEEGDLCEVIGLAKQADAGMIYLDTVSRVMQGGAENTSEDMGMFAGNISELASRTGAHVSGVHHGTQAEGTKSRGHSALPNAVDAVAAVMWDEETGNGELALDFARDDITGAIGKFRTETIGLGTDADGDKITSLVIEETGIPDRATPRDERARRAGRKAAGEPTHADRALDILADLCAREGRTGFAGAPPGYASVPEDWWRERFYDRAMPADDQDTKKHAFARAAKILLGTHRAGMAGGRVWVAKPNGAADDPL